MDCIIHGVVKSPTQVSNFHLLTHQTTLPVSRKTCIGLPGAGERHSTRDKGHEEGGLAYAKVASSIRSPPGYSRASTPKKPEPAYFIALCSHL